MGGEFCFLSFFLFYTGVFVLWKMEIDERQEFTRRRKGGKKKREINRLLLVCLLDISVAINTASSAPHQQPSHRSNHSVSFLRPTHRVYFPSRPSVETLKRSYPSRRTKKAQAEKAPRQRSKSAETQRRSVSRRVFASGCKRALSRE